MTDREKLAELLERRAAGDFAGMTDQQLEAYAHDLGRVLQAGSVPLSVNRGGLNAHDRERNARLSEVFQREIQVLAELARRGRPAVRRELPGLSVDQLRDLADKAGDR